VVANRYDGTTATDKWFGLALQTTLLDKVEIIFADGTFKDNPSRTITKIPAVPIAKKWRGQIHGKRWIVERIICWMPNDRRYSNSYERKTHRADAFLAIGNIRLLIKN